MKIIIYFKGRIRSFSNAFAGLHHLIKSQANTKIHLAATLLVLVTAMVVSISRLEWCLLIIVIFMVWAAEIFNTAIESLSDFISSDYEPIIKIVKDLSAAGVLVLAIGSIAIGLLIFLPHF